MTGSRDADCNDWETVNARDFLASSSTLASKPGSGSGTGVQGRPFHASRRVTSQKSLSSQAAATAPTSVAKSPKVSDADQLIICGAHRDLAQAESSFQMSREGLRNVHRSSCPWAWLQYLCVTQIWIAAILSLSVFWCIVSLLAISQLETRLPTELQEQLQFHGAFSGLWPRSQKGRHPKASIRQCSIMVSSLTLLSCITLSHVQEQEP
jgi:hypothetical protein